MSGFHSNSLFQGWGTTHDSKCTTNEFGPSPNTKCKFPFRYLLLTFRGCVYAPSPSGAEGICISLKKEEKMDTFPQRGEVKNSSL